MEAVVLSVLDGRDPAHRLAVAIGQEQLDGAVLEERVPGVDALALFHQQRWHPSGITPRVDPPGKTDERLPLTPCRDGSNFYAHGLAWDRRLVETAAA